MKAAELFMRVESNDWMSLLATDTIEYFILLFVRAFNFLIASTMSKDFLQM